MVFVKHNLCYGVSCLVVDWMRNITEFAGTDAFVRHGYEKIPIILYNAKIMHDEAFVYCDRCNGFELAGVFNKAQPYLGNIHDFPP